MTGIKDEDQNLNKFVQRFNEIEKKNFKKEHLPQKHCNHNWWLIKPAQMNQGKGIKISNK